MNAAYVVNCWCAVCVIAAVVVCFLSFVSDLQGFPKQPPLEVAITHATQCLKLMSKTGIGSCAFASISDTLR